MAVFQCARIEYYALSPGASTKSCAHSVRSYWRSFEAQRVMLDASALKRVVYFHISRVPRLTFFLSQRYYALDEVPNTVRYNNGNLQWGH